MDKKEEIYKHMKKQDIDEINSLRIALGMSGIATNNQACDLILEVQKAVKKHKGKFDLHMACKLKTDNETKYNNSDK